MCACTQGQQFAFDQHSVQFDSFYGPSGAISFSGRWRADGQTYRLTMVPQGNSAQVTALTQQMSTVLSNQELNMTATSAGKLCLPVGRELCHMVHAQVLGFCRSGW